MTALREHLRKEGITQRAIAAKLGVSTGYMSEIVSGQKLPSLELAVRIERLTDGKVPAAGWIPSTGDSEEDAA